MNQPTPAIHALSFLRSDTWPVNNSHLAARQAAFDFFVAALRKQGASTARSASGTAAAPAAPSCVYFDPATGNRCGIGHMIAPVYSKHLEGLSWDGLAASVDDLAACGAAVKHIDETFGLDSADRDRHFLSHMQSLHDAAAWHDKGVTFAAALERRAVGFASTWALTLPAQDN